MGFITWSAKSGWPFSSMLRCAQVRCRQCIVFIALGASGVMCTVAAGAQIHVPSDYLTIQTAITAAQDGDEIVVAPGTYNEAINLLGKSITVRSVDGPAKTIIDATGLSASVVTIAGGEGNDTIVDGFTITGGTGTVVGLSTRGGGIYIDGSSPSIANCVIIANSAAYAGAGIYHRNGDVSLVDCVITANLGNGLSHYATGTPIVTRCAFINNTSGAVDQQGGNAFFTDCVFDANTASAPWHVAVRVSFGMSNISGCMFLNHTIRALSIESDGVTVTNCLFRNNSGGALEAFSVAGPTTVVIEDSDFIDNASGAVSAYGNVTTHFTNCMFEGNSGHNGGAIRHGCLDFVAALCPTTFVSGCSFTANTASVDGGAIFTACVNGEYSSGCSDVTISSSTFSGNSAGAYGGAIRNSCILHPNPLFGEGLSCGALNITESVLVHNSAGLGGGAIANLDVSSGTFANTVLCQNSPEAILGDWIDAGGTVFYNQADLNCDGVVNGLDLGNLLANWSIPPRRARLRRRYPMRF